MRLIGVVQQLQIQRSSLKIGEKPQQTYNPASLLVVDSLEISPAGAVGCLADGARIIDVHNAGHPESKNSGVNGISVGFTAHYRSMRARFGPHLGDGIAGENILIETASPLSLADLGARLAFQGSGPLVYLDDLLVARPCVPFAHFAHRASPGSLAADVVKETLQFLNEGKRGFYATAHRPGVIAAGDQVYAVAAED